MSKYGHYIGVIDNLLVDKHRHNLWRPDEFTGTRLYANAPFPGAFYPATGATASFFGTGFVQHEMGEFSTSLGYSVLELDFRTLQENGILFAVTDAQMHYTFVVFLNKGRVNFRFEIQQDTVIELDSTK